MADTPTPRDILPEQHTRPTEQQRLVYTLTERHWLEKGFEPARAKAEAEIAARQVR